MELSKTISMFCSHFTKLFDFSSVDNFAASDKSFDLDALVAAVIDFLSVFFGKFLS